MMEEPDPRESSFKPFVSAGDTRKEFTLRAVLLGAILGIIFAASSVYLALKVGMTVSASIPVAVLSITLFRMIGRATILENNMVQTTGSAGESIAGVVTSALFIGLTVIALNKAYTTVVPARFPEYTATVPPDAERTPGPDGALYRVYNVTEPAGNVLAGKYLVDNHNRIQYLVDPGIAGVVTEVDGRHVTKLDSPKARLFSLIIDGILTRKLPWGLVLIGVFLALTAELLGVSSLPFAVGLYLPLSTSTPIMAGGLVRALVERQLRSAEREAEFPPGVLLSSGLIAGAAITGVLLAVLTGFGLDRQLDLSGLAGGLAAADWFALIPFGLLMYLLYRVGAGEFRKEPNHPQPPP